MLDRLRAAVVADPTALEELAAIEDLQAAIAALVDQAHTWGIPVAAEQLDRLLRPDPLGLDRFGIKPVTGLSRPGPNWLPAGLSDDGTQLTVDWAWFGEVKLRDPFFEAALRRALNRPISRFLCWRTPLGAWLDDPALLVPPQLDGLVFHMSRCGSTLVSQALGALPGAISLSEPRPLDDLLMICQARADIPFDTRVALIRAMAACLLSDRGEVAQRRFIKADSWHIAALPLLRAAFPDTPWIFLYRDPVDVMLSQQRDPGAQVQPGPVSALLGVADDGTAEGPDFVARVLAATCDAAADQFGQGGGLLIDYATLPDAISQRILPHFGIDPAVVDRSIMTPVLARDAKAPGHAFDPASRAATASPELLAAVDRHLRGPIARLDEFDRLTST